MKKLFITSIITASALSANIISLNTLESNFKQSITNEQNSRITYSGKMYASKQNNQALWEYTAPIEKKIYYKNGNIVIIEPELEQAIFAKLSRVPNILTLLSRAKKISSNKLVTVFNNIRYTITTAGDKIKSINYTDEIQNRVKIDFYGEKVNEPISSNRFRYSIPADYDILQQ